MPPAATPVSTSTPLSDRDCESAKAAMAPAVALHLQPRPSTLTLRKSRRRMPPPPPPPLLAPAVAPKPTLRSAPPLLDFLLFHVVTVIAAILCATAAALASLTRRLRRGGGKSGGSGPFPKHVAIAGCLRSPQDAARIAAMAKEAGAVRVTVFDPFGESEERKEGRRLLRGDKDDGGGGEGEGEGGVRYIRADGMRALELVRAARVLAELPEAERPVDARNPTKVQGWLEKRLGPDPDVLLVFVDPQTRLKCLGGFPVWGLRLAQICFVDVDVKDFNRFDMREVAGRAAAMPKRFGR